MPHAGKNSHRPDDDPKSPPGPRGHRPAIGLGGLAACRPTPTLSPPSAAEAGGARDRETRFSPRASVNTTRPRLSKFPLTGLVLVAQGTSSQFEGLAVHVATVVGLAGLARAAAPSHTLGTPQSTRQSVTPPRAGSTIPARGAPADRQGKCCRPG